MNIFNADSLTTNILFFTGGLSLLIAAGEMLVRRRRPENYIFAALLMTFGILVFQMGFIVERTVLSCPWLFSFNFTLFYFVAPVGYLAYYHTVFPSDRFPVRMIVFLVPSLVAFAFDVQYLLMPSAVRVSLLEALLYGGGLKQELARRVLYAGAGVQLFMYFAFLLYRFVLVWKNEGRATVLIISTTYIVYTVVTSEVVFSGLMLSLPGMVQWGTFMLSMVLISAFLVSQRFPRYLQLIIEETVKKYQSKSLLAGVDVDGVIRRLNMCMAEKKVFMNDELTLKDLADEVALSAHQLSQLLNERLSTSFNNFVNQYRIEYAKRLLLEEPDRSVLSIAFAAGFNTKSTFYYAFSRFTGKSPKDYRREKLGAGESYPASGFDPGL